MKDESTEMFILIWESFLNYTGAAEPHFMESFGILVATIVINMNVRLVWNIFSFYIVYNIYNIEHF